MLTWRCKQAYLPLQAYLALQVIIAPGVFHLVGRHVDKALFCSVLFSYYSVRLFFVSRFVRKGISQLCMVAFLAAPGTRRHERIVIFCQNKRTVQPYWRFWMCKNFQRYFAGASHTVVNEVIPKTCTVSNSQTSSKGTLNVE